MNIVKNKNIHIKRFISNQECDWKTFYKGEEVPDNWLSLFLSQGGKLEEVKPVKEKEEVKQVEPVKEKEEVNNINVDNMNKDELEKYALLTFDIDLDKRKSVYYLRNQVKQLIENHEVL